MDTRDEGSSTGSVAPWGTREVALIVVLWLGLSVAAYLPFRSTTSTDAFEGYVITTGTQVLERPSW